MQGLSLDSAGISALVPDYLPVIEAFKPAYVEEMHGIAERAAVPFEDVVLLNARTEILKLAARPDPHARLGREDEPETLAMILMDPERGVMEVAPLPALNRQFTTYTLDIVKALRPDRRSTGNDQSGNRGIAAFAAVAIVMPDVVRAPE